MDIFETLTGKTIKEAHKTDDGYIEIDFIDGSGMRIFIDSVNTSCWCHPEYEYYLDIETHL